MTHARYICKRLRAKPTQFATMIGLWTLSGNLDSAKSRIGCAADAPIVADFRHGLDQVRQLIQPKLVAATA